MLRYASLSCLLWIISGSELILLAAEGEFIGKEYQATDSLSPGDEASAGARECLEGLCWKPTSFSVTIESPLERGDFLLRFPSPRPRGEAVNDLAALECYVVRDAAGGIVRSPAVVVIHESGSSMPVGRLFAKGFQQRGVHAFMLQLPNYGVRRTQREIAAEDMLGALQQGVSDARRARDAVSVLPFVDAQNIGLQGTSLGGFVASTAGALDRGYQHVLLTLSGGDLYSIVKEGKRDAAKVRERLERAGVSDERLREITQAIEPNRLAHRLNPEQTFLYSGLFDDVVPIENARGLAAAAGLAPEHHTCMPADHYTGIVFLPVILDHMASQICGRPVNGPAVEASAPLAE